MDYHKKKQYRGKNKKDIQNNTICSLCKEHNTEISMPCAGMHSYCFGCIKKWLINKKDLTCPECRKTCENIIKLPITKNKLSSEFVEFLESIKIIPNPLKHEEDCKCFQTYFDNTCIYPNWAIIHFIENKEQLELYYETIKNPKYKDKTDELIKLIKWLTISEEDLKIPHEHNHP